VVEVLSICPPVRAKFPVAELLFDGTAILNIAVLLFSDNCKVKVRLPPSVPTTVAVAAAMLSKQLLLIVKLRLEMLTEAIGETLGFIIIGVSAILKVKLSSGEDMPPLMLLIVSVAIAFQVPVRLLPVTLLPLPLKVLLLIAPHPTSTKTRVADRERNNRVLRIGLTSGRTARLPSGRQSSRDKYRT
jgi:hypothetical protein